MMDLYSLFTRSMSMKIKGSRKRFLPTLFKEFLLSVSLEENSRRNPSSKSLQQEASMETLFFGNYADFQEVRAIL